jgi:hypothetical protein
MLKFFDRTANHKYPLMRQPDQLPRCYELTEHERLQKVKEWNNRNVWNTPDLSEQYFESRYYGA